ncbi:MAG: hypothetical protein ACLUH6_05800 [Bacteroides faecis]|uniref:Uncharacterized protein n=1 Tax=Bacteroides faecis TaxID=674529 RepID=A0A6N2V5H1_9BACE
MTTKTSSAAVTLTRNVDSQNVCVSTFVQFAALIEACPLSNVVLRDKKTDRFIVLKRVELFASKAVPTKDELLNAWKSMYFNTWKMKFEIEKCSHESLKSGNLFRNLDRFDVTMYLAGKKVFDTADYNLDLVEGKVGLTPKSKVREDFTTNKELKAHCYKVAERAWKLLNIDTLITSALTDAEKEEKEQKLEKSEKATKVKGKETAKATTKDVKSEDVKSEEVQVLAEVA